MSRDTERSGVQFEPLRPASSRRLIAAIVLGPLLWVIALIVAAWLFAYSWAIQLALLVTLASFLLALVVLSLMRQGRVRQERRYAARG